MSVRTEELAFSHAPNHLKTTTVYLLRPPPSHRPWVVAHEPPSTTTTTTTSSLTLLHPLTLKPHSYNLPPNLDLTKLQRSILVVSHNLENKPLDKLLVLPSSGGTVSSTNLRDCTLLALYNGGHLKGLKTLSSRWISLSVDKFDDITTWKNDLNIEKIYALARWGGMYVIYNYLSTGRIVIGKTLIAQSVPLCDFSRRLRMGGKSGSIRCRRRVAVDGKHVYLVVRWEERVLCVYKLMNWKSKKYWGDVKEFEGNKVLFMSRDYYFFCPASSEFPGREFENCIVFTEATFPQHGEDCWKFTQFDSQTTADDIAFFRLSDKTFAREGETSVFPEIDWSTPPWIFDVPERESDTQDTYKAGEEDGKVHSDLKDSNSKDEVEQEGMESEEDSGEQEQEVMEVDSNSEHQEDGIFRCDSDSQEKEDDEMHSYVNIFKSASLQEDLSPFINTVNASISAAEEEATITLLNMGDGNGETEKETSRKRKNNTEFEHRVSTLYTTKSHHTSDPQTTKFEGFDIKSDLVPTLQKIWRKHGNLIENSTMRSSGMIARALESLATMVQILKDNSAQSLSDGQIDYLTSTLSDLKCICFKVCWLSSCVDKAVQLHKSNSFVDSLKNLNQLSSEVKERRAVLLAKLDEAEQKLKEKMETVSKLIPFNGQFRLEEPLGIGLT